MNNFWHKLQHLFRKPTPIPSENKREQDFLKEIAALGKMLKQGADARYREEVKQNQIKHFVNRNKVIEHQILLKRLTTSQLQENTP